MRSKILINQIIIVLLSTIIVGSFVYMFIESNYTKSKIENLKSNETLIATIVDNELKNETNLNNYSLAQKLSEKLGYRITIFNIEGKPIADSLNNSIILESNHTEDSYNQSSNLNDIQKYFSPELGHKYFYLFLSDIKVNNETVLVRIGEPYGLIDYFVDSIFTFILISLFISLMLAIMVSFFTSKRLTEPLLELESAASNINRGNLGVKVSLKSTSEINNLAETFNQMSSKLEYLINDLKDQNIQKESILTNIEDGIIAIDSNENILFMNNSIYDILSVSKIDVESFKNYGEISMHLFPDILNSDEIKLPGFSKELKYRNDRIIRISTNSINSIDHLSEPLGVIISIRDMTELRTYENLRKDFVANISHELRTPLTSISGFLEIIEKKNLTEEMKKNSLDIVKIELKRLYDLIDKMLLLSKIEEINMFSRDKIDFQEIVLETKILLSKKFKEKQIKIVTIFNSQVKDFYKDKELIKLIFINIIENAITYGKMHGLIQVRILNLNNSIIISFKDNGIGIPRNELPFILERFYRAPHSKHLGNNQTGLGLSIVKSIIDSMNGEISIDSVLNEYTTIKIILRK